MYINKKTIKYIDKEDRIFINKLLDKYEQSLNNKEITLSNFLDPAKLSRAISFLNSHNITFEVFGGFEDSERNIIAFYSEYENISNDDFNITAIEISYIAKFSKKLSHRDFLGSLIALGLDRAAIGDIIVYDDKAVAFVKEDIADFIMFNLDKVSRTSVKNKINNDITVLKNEYDEKRITASSLRIDVILSEGFNLSRKKSSDFIKSEKVFLNWILTNNPAKEIKENDIITLRGMGRIVLFEILGKTKKDRYLINLKISK